MHLEPLRSEHGDALRTAASHPEIWTWMGPYPTRDDATWAAWFADALRRDDQQAFATIDATTGAVIGSTRFMTLRPADRGLEIGWTWLTPATWRKGANVEAKLLQLRYAFEVLRCIRVELKTHAANDRSRAAMTGLGFVFEGVHRKHRIVPEVGVRDSAWFSVLDDEAEEVLHRLEDHLAYHLRRSAGANGM